MKAPAKYSKCTLPRFGNFLFISLFGKPPRAFTFHRDGTRTWYELDNGVFCFFFFEALFDTPFPDVYQFEVDRLINELPKLRVRTENSIL